MLKVEQHFIYNETSLDNFFRTMLYYNASKFQYKNMRYITQWHNKVGWNYK